MGEIGKDKTGNFSVILDMNCFRLSEMSVKLVDGSVVVVEAKHGERPDEEYGSISRHFLHRYRLPSDIDPGSLISDLSDKGILTITAKKKRNDSTSSYTHSEEVLMDEARYIIDNYEHPNPRIFYTVTRVPGKDCPDSLSEQLSTGCMCTGPCTPDGSCSCLRNDSNYIISDGFLTLKKDRFGNVPVFECNLHCRCFGNIIKKWNECGEKRKNDLTCLNRWVQFGPWNDLEIFETESKGLGLKTTRRMLSGMFICEYAGEVIGLEEAKNRQKRNLDRGDMNYIFILKEYFTGYGEIVTCIDPTNVGNIGRYINHSCEPNAAIVPVRVNDMVPWLCVFACRDIEEGEEISFDYSGSFSGGVTDVINRKACHCNARTCRKLLPFQSV